MGEVDNIQGFERERSVLVERLNQPVLILKVYDLGKAPANQAKLLSQAASACPAPHGAFWQIRGLIMPKSSGSDFRA